MELWEKSPEFPNRALDLDLVDQEILIVELGDATARL